MAKVLTMTLKKRWFDMIKAGVKKEEYREVKLYWISRLLKNTQYLTNLEDVEAVGANFIECSKIQFVNGYGKDAPRFTIECLGIEIGHGKPEWGAYPDQKTFILKLGTIIS